MRAIPRCAVVMVLSVLSLAFLSSLLYAAPLSLSCANNVAEVGVAYSSALVASGGVAPYTFSIASGKLPPGLTLDPSTGAITGTPTASGTAFNYVAKVVDSAGSSVTTKCAIKVVAHMEVNCPTNKAVVGQPYSSAVVFHGGVPPYTFSISAGSLPPGLTLNPSTGVISGTPTMGGTFNFTIQVEDSLGAVATRKCGITIPKPNITLACASSTGQVGVAYSSALVAMGGTPPYTFSIASGSLPPGLTLNASTGAITGTPTASGTFSFTAKVVDSTGSVAGTAAANCSIVIAPPAVTLACASSTGQVGVAYSSALVAGGGIPPYTFSISSGSLPPGLTLNASTGAITGTPTAPGTFSFTAKVVDSTGSVAGTATANCSIVIAPPAVTLACASSTGQVGVAYSSALVAGGGIPPYTFSISSGSLPPGLSLNASTGAITGTPTAPGTFSFTAKVVDSTGSVAGTATANCSIVISPPPVTLACASSTGQVGVAYSSALVAGGGIPPYTFSISSGSLPPGLSLNASTGAITGTPTAPGTFSFTAKVVDSTGSVAGTATANCSIVIAPPAVTLACASSTGQVGVAYSSALVAGGGIPPYTFSISSGSLPPGLSLNASTGAITGTPTAPGTFSFTAQVVDSTGSVAGTATANCSIVIAPPPLTLVCASAAAQVGVPYSSAVVATGGTPPYMFSILSGSLPPGLTLNPTTGTITGTPTGQGIFSYTVQVKDATNATATANCTITNTPCGTALTPITYNVSEGSGMVNEIVWFNSHLTKLSGTIPNSDFQIFITGGAITFGPSTLSVPDAVITFSSSATCSQTTFNVAFNRWETTIPLSAASKADEIFAAGIAYQIPAGFPQNVNNVTWSANISSNASGIIATWQFGASNWLTQNNGSMFPALSSSPFVPDYNGMMVTPAHNAPLCSGNTGDHAGAPEFAGRGDVLVGGGSGGGGSNWTGSWSSTPPGIQICQPGGPCVAASINQSIQPATNFAAIGLEGSNFQLSSGPLQVNGNLGIGNAGLFHLSGGATLNATLFADPGATVQIDGGSGVSGGTVTQSLSPLQTAALSLSNSAAALSPTQTFTDITSATTITGSGGQNVINVTGTFHLSGGNNLTISGGPSDAFIFNAANGLQLDGGANIVLAGVSPNQVLFNFPLGSAGQVQTSGQAHTAGIFLAPSLQMQINGGVHNSEFISGGALSFQSNPAVTAPLCTE